ncbi:hypothetical protein NQD34_018341 [Periophthalmus magnuspinnatus]|nr:hypothetical protein NQD34_018341 [Periophthalmus magnuspinnatus]
MIGFFACLHELYHWCEFCQARAKNACRLPIHFKILNFLGGAVEPVCFGHCRDANFMKFFAKPVDPIPICGTFHRRSGGEKCDCFGGKTKNNVNMQCGPELCGPDSI